MPDSTITSINGDKSSLVVDLITAITLLLIILFKILISVISSFALEIL